ncbi:hypothetical protein SCL_2128 [Sulfuricaulis limicola]|uniref:SnoaL-like domain-containing protein n=2 Tax=Sulfuricaulis limicola TaxID=1620215 RepID=A0A1B4XHY3_9GAMM|nr:hypothetical protein SCL_2128 [Sulfuricaulis limicola]
MADMGRFRFQLWPVLILVLSISIFNGACSSERDSPEAQVRALLAQGEAAAEKKESGVLRQMVSEKYADSQGQDKKAIDAILRYYFLRNQSIHLFTRIRLINFPQPGVAQADVMVAMAGQPISGAEELERLRADLHRFEITLARENGEWKVIRAEWRRAEFADFL